MNTTLQDNIRWARLNEQSTLSYHFADALRLIMPGLPRRIEAARFAPFFGLPEPEEGEEEATWGLIIERAKALVESVEYQSKLPEGVSAHWTGDPESEVEFNLA